MVQSSRYRTHPDPGQCLQVKKIRKVGRAHPGGGVQTPQVSSRQWGRLWGTDPWVLSRWWGWLRGVDPWVPPRQWGRLWGTDFPSPT